MRRSSAGLPEPSRTLMTLVNDRNVVELGRRLLPYVESMGGAPALSPDRSPAAKAPVFLLHGSADNVIPSEETPRLAGYLEQHGNARVEWLLTPLISHATVHAAAAGDALRLIGFWKDVLGERGSGPASVNK